MYLVIRIEFASVVSFHLYLTHHCSEIYQKQGSVVTDTNTILHTLHSLPITLPTK